MEAAMEALHQLKSTEAPLWLAPKQELSESVRLASKLLFSCLKPHTPKLPFDQLLVEGFDAEQIGLQIDLQSQPLISTLRREVRKFDKNPKEISKLNQAFQGPKKSAFEEESDRGADQVDDDDEDEDDDMALDSDDEDDESEEKEEEEDEDTGSEGEGIEDGFLKLKELRKYCEEDEAKEFGLKKKTKSKGNRNEEEDDDEEGEDDEEDEDEEDELGVFDGDDGDEDEEEDKLASARYEDFYGTEKKKKSKRKARYDSEETSGSEEDEQDDDNATGNQKRNDLSKHEKELKMVQSEIEQMEKSNMDPKVWTMRGEVTAAQRQKNSALEVDLDFEHNVRPAPVITEEVTASLEDIIKNRIVEARFDDVQKAPTLSSKAPREIKEMDETKSKKSIADLYEEDYMKKTNPASAPLSFSDEQKKEASMLFKRLCLKLDALSHFHFTPKPVIEDMVVQSNLPALAMEEIAPVAVSDAAMLAPEEVFSGKGGNLKEECELSKEERKRRRANKKRKFKGRGGGAVEERIAKKKTQNKEEK